MELIAVTKGYAVKLGTHCNIECSLVILGVFIYESLTQ